MYSQIQVISFCVLLQFITFIRVPHIFKKELNLLNKDISKQTFKSDFFKNIIKKEVYLITTVYILILLYAIYILITSSELILFVVMMFLLFLTTVFLAVTYAYILQTLSLFELRLSKITKVNLNKEVDIKKINLNVYIMSSLNLVVYLAIIISDIVFNQAHPFLSFVFILLSTMIPILGNIYISKYFNVQTNELLKNSVGFLNTEEVKQEMANLLKEKGLKDKDIKEKIIDLKSKK